MAVLHRPHRPAARSGGTARQAAGVRGARLAGGGRARPAGPGDARALLVDWSEPEREPHARVLDWYRRLIALRAEQPDLTDPDLADTRVAYDGTAGWLAFRRGDIRVAVNLGTEPAAIPLGNRPARVLAAWEPVEGPGANGILRVPGESSVVLAQE
ncbi:hypothetical protein STENM327S_02865 [Streptomyces tendae]